MVNVGRGDVLNISSRGRRASNTMRISFFSLAAFVAACMLSASIVNAVTIGVSQGDLAAGKPQFAPPHGTGTNSFGYDWDSAAPNVTTGSAPAGYGPNS